MALKPVARMGPKGVVKTNVKISKLNDVKISKLNELRFKIVVPVINT